MAGFPARGFTEKPPESLTNHVHDWRPRLALLGSVRLAAANLSQNRFVLFYRCEICNIIMDNNASKFFWDINDYVLDPLLKEWISETEIQLFLLLQ